jgi:hypothetical protein
MRRVALVGLLVCGLTLQADAVAQGPNIPPVESLMDSATFSRTGLHKLSDEELANLNVWLGAFARSVLSIYGNSPSAPTSTSNVIESRIDGEFEGWEGDTIFRLQNGQVWQQSSYAYRYSYAYSPRVTIYPVSGGYEMKVDGVNDTVRVKRIR